MATGGRDASDAKRPSNDEYRKEKNGIEHDSLSQDYHTNDNVSHPPPSGAPPNAPISHPPHQPLPRYPVARPQNVTVVLGRLPAHKSVFEAYMLCLPFGIIGLHHFYLKRYGFGLLYFFTFGLCGVGWLVDIVRLPRLVAQANRRIDNPAEFEPLTLSDAYILWFPLGIIGLHQYYLRRPAWGVAYTFSFGLFGIGWLVDSVRIPSLVQDANVRLEREHLERGMLPRNAKLCDAYALGVTPIGILGAHHFYLGNYAFGVFYLFTMGSMGIGWMVDWFRMYWLVHRVNHPEERLLGTRHKYVDDAYVLAFPFGLLGAHHFYLERPGWGALYFFTFGLMGLGWLIDLARMPCLVADTNARLEAEMSMLMQIRDELGAGTAARVTTVTRSVGVYPAGEQSRGACAFDEQQQHQQHHQHHHQHQHHQHHQHEQDAARTETPILQPPPPYSASVHQGGGYNSMGSTQPTAPTPGLYPATVPPAYTNEGYTTDTKY